MQSIVLAVTLALAAVLILLLIIIIKNKQRLKERAEEKDAAIILLKEQQLINAIDINSDHKTDRDRLILVVSWKDEKKRKFVFDPAQGVKIGKGMDKNHICIPIDTVSNEHCMIFSSGSNLYVRDLNSTYGTYIKRGFKTYKVKECVPCFDNDTIIVSGIGFKIRSFYMDSAYL